MQLTLKTFIIEKIAKFLLVTPSSGMPSTPWKHCCKPTSDNIYIIRFDIKELAIWFKIFLCIPFESHKIGN